MKIIYKQTPNSSDEDSQHSLDKVYDILFSEITRRINNDKQRANEEILRGNI